MNVPLQITFRDIPSSPAVEERVRELAGKLETLYGRIVGCRVVVETEGNRHLTGHDYVVTATLELRDGVIVAGQHKRHPDLPTALDCTFGTLVRRLDEYARCS
jgi:ribosome-associated translation inhibitor RaiA